MNLFWGDCVLLWDSREFVSRLYFHWLFRSGNPCVTVDLQVMDKHLSILAKQHIETRFVKIHAEKSPFLAEKLKIVVLPTLALIKNAKVDDYVVLIFLDFLTKVPVFVLVCTTMHFILLFRWGLINLAGQMSLQQRNLRRDWLKLK